MLPSITTTVYKILVKLLFLMPAETAHYFTLNVLHLIQKIPGVYGLMRSINFVKNEVKFVGITFPNRVGLAAGFDKNAKYLREFQSMGFGFVEIGTVTPLAQPGNDKPRLFRLIKDEAIINRMGFNNDGVDVVVERLKNRPKDLIVGGNIGKNKITPNENAQRDYEICFERLYDVVDYFVVNVSSPNTPGLRELQEKESLRKIFAALQNLNKNNKPILLKMAPDLETSALDDIIALTNEIKIDGLVATNTTIDRSLLNTMNQEKGKKMGAGGLSGQPLLEKSTEVLKYLHKGIAGRIPIIASGGIFTGADAESKINAGASLLQIWTGFIYEGPMIVKNICQHLSAHK